MPRNTAQQLYDVGYVVYGGEREGGEGGRKKEEGRQQKKNAKEGKGYRQGRGNLNEREGEMKVKWKEIAKRGGLWVGK